MLFVVLYFHFGSTAKISLFSIQKHNISIEFCWQSHSFTNFLKPIGENILENTNFGNHNLTTMLLCNFVCIERENETMSWHLELYSEHNYNRAFFEFHLNDSNRNEKKKQIKCWNNEASCDHLMNIPIKY